MEHWSRVIHTSIGPVVTWLNTMISYIVRKKNDWIFCMMSKTNSQVSQKTFISFYIFNKQSSSVWPTTVLCRWRRQKIWKFGFTQALRKQTNKDDNTNDNPHFDYFFLAILPFHSKNRIENTETFDIEKSTWKCPQEQSK